MIGKPSISHALCLLFIAFSLSAFADDKLNITQVGPSHGQPGHEFMLEIHFHKGNVTGFAKYQCELQEGLLAKEEDSQNASFTFIDQKVKFIWMTLPAEQDFVVKFKVMVASTIATETAMITGTFSYVENNETQKFKVEPLNLIIDPIPPLPKAEPTTSKMVIIDGVGQKTDAPNLVVPNDVSHLPEPEAKFDPAKDIKLQSAIREEEEAKRRASGKKSGIETASEPKSDPVPAKPESKKEEPKNSASKEIPVKPTPSEPKVKSESETSGKTFFKEGVTFRVQIAVSRNPSEIGALKTKSGQAELQSENVDGNYKFTAGNYKSYSDATALKNEMRVKGFDGAFVVAYKNGSRITLQEALKETHQK